MTKAQRRRRDTALSAAETWLEHDLVLLRDKECWETAGLLIGPVVRASGNTGLIGTRLMELGEREKLRDPACQICADGKEVCLKNCTHDGCHTGASGEGCRYPHLDPKLFVNGLPPQLKDANCVGRLPKELKIFGVAHGGFRCVPKIPVEDRVRQIDRIRSTGKGGALVSFGGVETTLGASAQLPPLSVVGAVATSGHLGESPLRELITGSASTLADLQVPPPKRPHAEDSLDGEALADDRSSVARGQAWRAEVVKRVEPTDAGGDNDVVVMWAARVMDRIVTDRNSDGSVADVDDAFGLAMAEGLNRGSRVLSAFCARYAPRTPDQAATVAGGFRSVVGAPLLMVHGQRKDGPKLGDYDLHVVELCGAVFHALDAGSDVAGHGDQCVLVGHSLLDLVYDGVAITEDVVVARGDAIALAFTEQAREALGRLGDVPERLTVREAELYQDLRDILEWNDHDARLSVHLGHGLPARLAFSTRPWERMRLVVVACVGPGSSVRVYVIVGSQFTSECSEGGGDAWTAWLLVYKNHAVPMRLVDSVFAGEVGASRFLRSLPCFGIAPVTMKASSWRAIVAARGRGTEVEPLLPVDVLRRVVRDPFRARGGVGADGGVKSAARRAKSFAAVEHTLAPEIARWCRRFVRGGGAAGEAVDVALMGGAVLPPALPSSCGGQSLVDSNEGEQRRGGGLNTAVPSAASETEVTAGGRWTSDAPGRYLSEPEAPVPAVPSAAPDPSPAPAPAPAPPAPTPVPHGSVCHTVGCSRPARVTASFVGYDGVTRSRVICCFPCVTEDGHSPECDAATEVWRQRRLRRRLRGGVGHSGRRNSATPTAAATTSAASTSAAPSAAAPTPPPAAAAATQVKVDKGLLRAGDGGVAWTPRHEELRAALLSSKALEPLERSGSDTEALDFVRHVVIEVEKRVDHGLLGKPLATEVDWKEWVRHIAWLAAQDGRHVGCAVRFLKLKDAADLAGSSDQRGSGVDSDDLVEASESVINDVLNEEENKGDVWYDCDEQELTSGQLSLKVALFASGALGEPGEWLPAELNDFVDWVVRQVERRLDSEHPATRTLSGNVSWEWWVEHLARLALHRSIHVTAANKHLESLPPPLTYASDSDSDDDGDVFEIDGSIEVEGPRAGKSRERREAEAMTGPVTIPVVDESADAQAHRSFSYSTIMAMKVSVEEAALSTQLCELAETSFDEAAVMTRGSAEEAEFQERVVRATELGDSLTRLCGGYRRAIAVFRQRWWSSHERFAIPERMENLRGLTDGNLLEYCKLTAERGVDVRTGAPAPSGMTNVRSHQSVEEHPTETLVKVWEDFARCGALFVSEDVLDLLADVQCAPMSRVDKSDDEGFKTDEGRFVYDGRNGGSKAVNKKTPVATHPPSAAPTHLGLIVYLVWLMLSFPGVPILCCKRDVKAAFKLVWYSVADSNWFGVRFVAGMCGKAAARVKWRSFFALFLVLVFGWSESPGEYGVYGWMISQSHRSLGPSHAVQLAALAFFNMCFVDDAAVFELDMYGRAQASCRAYDWCLFQALGRALNLKKIAVDGMLGLSHTFWGITYHLERAAEGVVFVWVELTRSKKAKAAAMVRMPFAQPGVRQVRLVDHQRLTGNVQWWSVCAPALRGLLGSLYAMSASCDSVWLAPAGSAEEVAMMWQEYDDVKTLLRTLVEFGSHDEKCFQARIVDALDFYDLAHMPVGLGLKVRYVGSDANGHETGGLLSVVDYEARTWAFARAAEYAPALLDKLGMEGAQMEKELIIFVTELLAVISLAAQHGASWSGSVVASLIDNDNANIALNTRRSRNRYVRYLLLVLGALEFRYRFRLVAYYINTHSNWLLDGIGRFERFSDKDDDEVREMIQKELIDEHVPGFVFEPLDELIKFFSSGDTVMKSFAIPDGSLDSVAAMFELSDCPELVRETAVSDECRDAALAAGGVGLGEIAAGTGALSHAGCKLGVPTVFFMEWDAQKFKYLESLHPSAVHKCFDIMGSEYTAWLFPGLQPRILCGGPPCVFAAKAGRQLGLVDARSRVFTHGAGLVIRGVSRGPVDKVWFVVLENVGEVAVLESGSALLELLRDLYSIGFVLSPLPPGGVLDLQVLEAHMLGGWAVRSRIVIALERRWIRRWLGDSKPIEYPVVAPARMSEVLEDNEEVPLHLVMPGRFYPIPGAKPDERGVVLAGFYEYGAIDDAVVRGSLVRVRGSKSSWRVMTKRETSIDLLKSDRRDPVHEKNIPLVDVIKHVRERVPVRSENGRATTICRFGEPGAVGGPGHQLVFRPGLGVTMLTARELWRLQGAGREDADERYDKFVELNPTASYEDLAGAAGDAIAAPWADAVIARATDRSVRLVLAAQRRLAAWARTRTAAGKSGSGRHP